MSGFIDESDRFQGMLLPERVDEYVSDENPVRIIDVFIGELDLAIPEPDPVLAPAGTGSAPQP
jgi:hypothetical protein